MMDAEGLSHNFLLAIGAVTSIELGSALPTTRNITVTGAADISSLSALTLRPPHPLPFHGYRESVINLCQKTSQVIATESQVGVESLIAITAE